MARLRLTRQWLEEYAQKAARAGDWSGYGCRATEPDPILGPSVTVACLEVAAVSVDGTATGARCQGHA